jgi:hypothetical protein
MARHLGRWLLVPASFCAVLGTVTAAVLVPAEAHQVVPYSWHPGITATVFWCNEPAGPSNAGISNRQSEYDLRWGKHCAHENQYYVAIPYADHLDDGQLNPDNTRIPWHNPATTIRQSEMKNHWVQVQRRVGRRNITAFGQVEDVGPSQYTSTKQVSDPTYVFGPAGHDPTRPITVKPKNTFGERAGIDLSPTLARYLHICADSSGVVRWRFWSSPNAATVPRGPWRKVVTTSPPNAWNDVG